MATKQEKTSVDYVSNKDLLKAFIEYHEYSDREIAEGRERPELSKPIALAIIQIATRLSTRWNFANYSYREEMIGDAIIKCVAKAHLFDPKRYNNPFAYLTMICFNEMIARIKKEHKEVSIKSRLIRETVTQDFLDMVGEDEDFKNAYTEFLKTNEAYKDYELESKEKKKKKKDIATLEELFADNKPEEDEL